MEEPEIHAILLDSTGTSDSQSESDAETNYDELDEADDLPGVMMRLLLSVVLPMWIAMFLSSFFFVVLRHCMMMNSGDSDPLLGRDSALQITDVSYSDRFNTFPTVSAVPALFGSILKETQISPIVLIPFVDCFQVPNSRPVLSNSQIQNLKNSGLPYGNKTHPIQWTAIVERGHCAFDDKVLHLQKQGYHNVIVYNYNSGDDTAIRMAANRRGQLVTAKAAYLTRRQVTPMLKILKPLSPRLVSITPAMWGMIIDLNSLQKLIIRVSIKTGITAIMMVCIFSSIFFALLLRNRIVNNDWQVRETIEYILFEAEPPSQSRKLVSIDFPSQTLTPHDLELAKDEYIGIRQGCAICIEEFTSGQEARILPCKHAFHANW